MKSTLETAEKNVFRFVFTAGTRLNGEEERLRACYLAALRLAASKGMRKLAFPLISAGANGYPRAHAHCR